jgi:polysaccharide biosynthesis transport protein
MEKSMNERTEDRSLPSSPRGSADEGPRYASLSDYLRVIRRYRVMIALITVAFAALALAISLAQSKKYVATAQLNFQDANQYNALLGGNNVISDVPATVRAAANAAIITRPDVTMRVKRQLHSKLSLSELQDAVNAQVGVTTNLVSIQASSTDPRFAARLANAYAKQAKVAATRKQLQQLDKAENGLRQQIGKVKATPVPGTSSLRLLSVEDQLARLQALKSISDPVVVANGATAPSAPVSPHPKRNTALGGLLGLVVGLLLAFARDVLDRRLHTPREIHDELGVPVLSHVSETALGFPGLVQNGKAAIDEGDFEPFRVLRMNLGVLGAERPPRSLLVTSGLPEEGKSAVSMSLASAAAIAGQRVLLVECDLRRPSFARRLGIPREPGLADYLLGRADPRDILHTVALAPPSSGNGQGAVQPPGPSRKLVCIAAGSQISNPAELLIGDRFKDFIRRVTKAYDLVVLDASPFLAVVDPLEIIPEVDGVLVCVRARRATRDQARAMRGALSNVADRPIGAVVTGIKRGDAESYDYYYGY